MVRGRGLSASLLLAVALVVGALSWMGWKVYANQGHLLPSVSWFAAMLLLLLAALVVSAGLPVRRFLKGQSTRTLNPLRAARTLILAQASALTGAAALGWYAGQTVLVLPDLDFGSNRTLLWRLATAGASALVLMAAGLWTQRMCRIDPPKDDPTRS